MPNPDNIAAFRKGLQVLASADDYLSLKNTIVYLFSVTEIQDEMMAKDAIANVLRKKQAVDIQRFQHYPKELEAIDQRYKDLAGVLETIGASLPNSEPPPPPALTDNNKSSGLGVSPLNLITSLSKTAILEWLMHHKAISLGSAAALAGGSYLVYRKFFMGKEDNPVVTPADKESNFERTIKSIQKYRAFSQLSKDPEFDGNYLEVFQGGTKAVAKKKKPASVKKKSSDDIGDEWDREEKSLMQNMDVGFNEIAIRPRIEFQMPQLPAPKTINPDEILGSAEPIEEDPFVTVKKRSKSKKVEAKKESRRDRSTPSQSMGRLVPIVKRTKRIKKVEV